MIAGLRHHAASIATFAVAYGLLSAAIGNAYHQQVLAQVLVWALLAVAWNLFSGTSGLISFGHAAFFGIGAFVATLALARMDVSPWIGIPLGGVVASVAALIIGLPTFRLRGHYFGLAMLAYPVTLLYVFQWLGLQEVSLPMKRSSTVYWMQFSDPRALTLVILAVLVAALALHAMLEKSRYGLALAAIRLNEAAAEAAGIDARRWKMKALSLSAFIAGIAGGLYAVIMLVVTPPAVFGMMVSAQALVLAMFGGVASLWGPVIGAVFLIPLSETLLVTLGERLPGIQGVIYGATIIVIVLRMPEGIYWRLYDIIRARRATSGNMRAVAQASACPDPAGSGSMLAPRPSAPVAPLTGAPALVLEARGLNVRFGGVRALADLDIEVRRGECLGIIGPNGAGKTTLFNVLDGFVRPSSGIVRLEGLRIDGLAVHRICAHGVGRTFQSVRLFARLTILENVMAGALVATESDAEARARARAALDRVGLTSKGSSDVGSLTNLELRLTEIARALAGGPRLLLLDETLAGLGKSETPVLLEVLRRLKEEGVTIVIIEHTIDALIKIADRLIVLDHGRLIADGDPRTVLEDRTVAEAYLGQSWGQRAEAS